MNPITFPGLGITVQIERVAFSILGKNIYWYGIIIAAGFLIAVAASSALCKQWGLKSDTLLDLLFFAAPIGIVCARAYYVIFYLELYTNADGSFNLGKAVAIWDGGLAIYGGIIGATVTAAIFCLVRHHSFPAVADVCSFGLLIGQAIGRWGNFINQEAYGTECTLPWRMGLTLTNGTYLEVHPTFLYESLWNLVGLALLFFVVRRFRRYDGEVFLSYLAWYGLGRFFVEGLRTDSLYLFSTGIRVSQLVALVTLVVCGATLIVQRLRAHPAERMLVNSPASELREGEAPSDTETPAGEEAASVPETHAGVADAVPETNTETENAADAKTPAETEDAADAETPAETEDASDAGTPAETEDGEV